jgi:hypothetical protein
VVDIELPEPPAVALDARPPDYAQDQVKNPDEEQ